MIGEEQINKNAVDYARERLSTEDYPLYNDEYELMLAFDTGAQCVNSNLWKPADGDDLPEIDREVIVLCQPYPCEGNEYVVSFAHRPPEYWEGRSITTGETHRYEPERYDKGGWNIQDVKWWLDIDLPKMEE